MSRALHAIANRLQLNLTPEVQTRFGVMQPDELSLQQASQLIDTINCHRSGQQFKTDGYRKTPRLSPNECTHLSTVRAVAIRGQRRPCFAFSNSRLPLHLFNWYERVYGRGFRDARYCGTSSRGVCWTAPETGRGKPVFNTRTLPSVSRPFTSGAGRQ
jgi:hypothetical protein